MTKPAQVALQVVALCAFGVLAGAAHSWCTPVRLRLEPVVVKPPPDSPAPSKGEPARPSQAPQPAPLGPHITLIQAKTLFDQGVAFVDARTDRDYLAGIIPGAHHITPTGFSRPETTEKLRFLDPSQPLVVYCGGGDCHDSENLVILFQQSGYSTLHIMTDGFPAWKNAGYEVEIPAPDPSGAP